MHYFTCDSIPPTISNIIFIVFNLLLTLYSYACQNSFFIPATTVLFDNYLVKEYQQHKFGVCYNNQSVLNGFLRYSNNHRIFVYILRRNLYTKNYTYLMESARITVGTIHMYVGMYVITNVCDDIEYIISNQNYISCILPIR